MEATRNEVVSVQWYFDSNAFVIPRLTRLLKGYRTLASKSITRIILGTEGSSDYELEKNGY